MVRFPKPTDVLQFPTEEGAMEIMAHYTVAGVPERDELLTVWVIRKPDGMLATHSDQYPEK